MSSQPNLSLTSTFKQHLEGRGYELYESTTADAKPRHKILRSYLIDSELAYSWKLYCVGKGQDASRVVELAMSHYMIEFPNESNMSYTVVVQGESKADVKQETEKCGVGNCDNDADASAKGVFLDSGKTYRLCSYHAKEYAGSNYRKQWRVF